MLMLGPTKFDENIMPHYGCFDKRYESNEATGVLGGAHEIFEQGVRCERLRFQFWVELNADKPRVVGPFYDLGQSSVG